MIEDAYRKCLLCDADMPAWSLRNVCYKHPFGELDHRLDETTPAAGGSVAGRGDEARGHQSATTDPAQLFDKVREILADYDAGRPLQVRGDGWLVRFAVYIYYGPAAVWEQESASEARDGTTASSPLHSPTLERSAARSEHQSAGRDSVLEEAATLIEKKHTNNVGMVHPMAASDAAGIRSLKQEGGGR